VDRTASRHAHSLDLVRKMAAQCRNCPLWQRATQTVFGQGSGESGLMLIGEQPGDIEDREGRPFVGPAGQLLDRALEEAGIDRLSVYVTNAVKHFKWEPRGKRRLHSKPNAQEIAACRPWLDAELVALRPAVVVCLGATAARVVLGSEFRVSRQRGQWFARPFAPNAIATVHPSSLLREPDPRKRERAMNRFVLDLKTAKERLS